MSKHPLIRVRDSQCRAPVVGATTGRRHPPPAVAALLAASKTQAERPLRLAFADRPPNPVRQWPREMVTGQAARPEATLTPRPIFTARHAQDALFERWDDKILGVPAWNFLR